MELLNKINNQSRLHNLVVENNKLFEELGFDLDQIITLNYLLETGATTGEEFLTEETAAMAKAGEREFFTGTTGAEKEKEAKRKAELKKMPKEDPGALKADWTGKSSMPEVGHYIFFISKQDGKGHKLQVKKIMNDVLTTTAGKEISIKGVKFVPSPNKENTWTIER